MVGLAPGVRSEMMPTNGCRFTLDGKPQWAKWRLREDMTVITGWWVIVYLTVWMVLTGPGTDSPMDKSRWLRKSGISITRWPLYICQTSLNQPPRDFSQGVFNIYNIASWTFTYSMRKFLKALAWKYLTGAIHCQLIGFQCACHIMQSAWLYDILFFWVVKRSFIWWLVISHVRRDVNFRALLNLVSIHNETFVKKSKNRITKIELLPILTLTLLLFLWSMFTISVVIVLAKSNYRGGTNTVL